MTTLVGYWFCGWVSNKPKFDCSEQLTRIVRPLDGCVKQATKPIFFFVSLNPKRKVWFAHLLTLFKRWSFFLVSRVRGVKHITRAEKLNKTPPNTLFFSFLFYPEKLGGFIRFHRKRVTSCGSRNRTCVVELMRLSWCLLQSTPPYHIRFRTCYRLAKTMTEVILFSQVHTRPLF